MNTKMKTEKTTSPADLDERLDAGLGALIPRDEIGSKLFDLLKEMGELPIIGNVVKPIALAGAWWLEDRKPDRVFPVLVAVREKISEVEKNQNEYVRREEFKDLFEDALRRIADEPDPERRKWFQNILLRVIDEPKEHSHNRLFLRLVEELSSDAHKVLAALDMPLTQADRNLERDDMLAKRSSIPRDRIAEAMDELARLGLLDRDRFSGPDPSKAQTGGVSLSTPGSMQFETRQTHGQDSLSYMFTRLGRDFIKYRRG